MPEDRFVEFYSSCVREYRTERRKLGSTSFDLNDSRSRQNQKKTRWVMERLTNAFMPVTPHIDNDRFVVVEHHHYYLVKSRRSVARRRPTTTPTAGPCGASTPPQTNLAASSEEQSRPQAAIRIAKHTGELSICIGDGSTWSEPPSAPSSAAHSPESSPPLGHSSPPVDDPTDQGPFIQAVESGLLSQGAEVVVDAPFAFLIGVVQLRTAVALCVLDSWAPVVDGVFRVTKFHVIHLPLVDDVGRSTEPLVETPMIRLGPASFAEKKHKRESAAHHDLAYIKDLRAYDINEGQHLFTVHCPLIVGTSPLNLANLFVSKESMSGEFVWNGAMLHPLTVLPWPTASASCGCTSAAQHFGLQLIVGFVASCDIDAPIASPTKTGGEPVSSSPKEMTTIPNSSAGSQHQQHQDESQTTQPAEQEKLLLVLRRSVLHPGVRLHTRGINNLLGPANEYEVDVMLLRRQLLSGSVECRNVSFGSNNPGSPPSSPINNASLASEQSDDVPCRPSRAYVLRRRAVFRRGSVPLRWRSVPSVSDKQLEEVQICRCPNNDVEHYYWNLARRHDALVHGDQKHEELLVKHYDLLDQRWDQEAKLSTAMDDMISYVTEKLAKHTRTYEPAVAVAVEHFNWHQEVKVGGLARVLDNLAQRFREDCATTNPQRTMVRLNCRDSLDRTNVASFMLVVEILREWGMLGVDDSDPGQLLSCVHRFHVHGGDSCSMAYTGTPQMHAEQVDALYRLLLSRETGRVDKWRATHRDPAMNLEERSSASSTPPPSAASQNHHVSGFSPARAGVGFMRLVQNHLLDTSRQRRIERFVLSAAMRQPNNPDSTDESYNGGVDCTASMAPPVSGWIVPEDVANITIVERLAADAEALAAADTSFTSESETDKTPTSITPKTPTRVTAGASASGWYHRFRPSDIITPSCDICGLPVIKRGARCCVICHFTVHNYCIKQLNDESTQGFDRSRTCSGYMVDRYGELGDTGLREDDSFRHVYQAVPDIDPTAEPIGVFRALRLLLPW